MAKKDYMNLALEIVKFQAEDVVTASKGNNFASAPESWFGQGGNSGEN